MLGLSLRALESIASPPLGRKKTVRSSSPPPLIQGRLSHERPCFCISVMKLLYSYIYILSCDVKKRNWVVVGWSRILYPIPLDGDSATIRNFGQNDTNSSRNAKSAVEA